MATSRPSTAAPILAAIAILLLPLVAYVAGYFALGTHEELSVSLGYPATGPHIVIERTYPAAWQMTLFEPAGKVEQTLRGVEVLIYCESHHP